MPKETDKEKDFFHLLTFTNSDLYIRYRRLSEFKSALSAAKNAFTEQVAANILNQENATQRMYLDRINKKINAIDVSGYADYLSTLHFLKKYNFEWLELDAFYRTMHDFYTLSINEAGVIGYYNKEPDIPTDYEAPEMAFLKKGIGFLTSEDARMSQEYSEKYGKYIYDVWDIFNKDILPEKRFLELLPLIYGTAALLPTHFNAQVAGEPLATVLQLKFYVFNGLQQQSLLEAKTFINQTRRSLMKEQGIPSFDNFEIYIKSFEYNYPYKDAVVYSLNRWKTNMEYLQKEILENLIILDALARKIYLKRLRLDCERLLKNAHTPLEGLNEWLEKYKTSLWEVVDEHPFIKTELNNILETEPETFKESFEPDVNQFSSLIRHNFYNYFYGYYLEQGLNFIAEQEEPEKSSLPNAGQPKLKTILTVPQLAYLFKLLMDEGLFTFKHKTEVHKFIATSFETEKSKEISADSIKNHMDGPDMKNVDKIQEKVIHLLQAIQKDKDSIGK